ncbi:hypothetical protein BDZ94DRAFT_1312254 [Collybia nuda]|uniref:ATP-dependent DNA helicase n=1 Tax=Collybia nuda TaxID=64659 RepID=A0A9P6CBL6_9AGAR|nr:hypothetical protein BDZ94DRAFT_1312254 [Collybia nuda]
MAEVRSRLEGVDYVFFDEVSMLSCKDMYRISVRLAHVLNNVDDPFGGMNMIFSGDFAQLPPVMGGEGSALYSRTVGRNSKSRAGQEAAIGKALWHQVTTVVILRENMRLKSTTPQDAQLRLALENMRYRACTPGDLAFLCSLVSSEIPGWKSIKDPEFRNVSIITSLNIHKDMVNFLGCHCFAQETKQVLQEFFSEDTISGKDERIYQEKKGWSYRSANIQYISDDVQKILWNQPHSANSKLIPGKLFLCVGLPVMIRQNMATELGITRGQEAIVHAWNSSLGSRGCEAGGLNVVPLTHTSVNTMCSMPDATTLNISQSMVEVLPNFSMTDYASQGKTCIANVMDVNNSRSHQSYYTALSRGVSAQGTIILQGFDAKKMAGGASGALRQEFRELELLDNITSLHYRGKLPLKVWDGGDLRNGLIRAFRTFKGKKYMPPHIHRSVRWGPADPFLDPSIEGVRWEILKFIGTVSLPESVDQKSNNPSAFIPVVQRLKTDKRKMDYMISQEPGPAQKKQRGLESLTDEQKIVQHQGLQLGVPVGTQWSNNSCAFDTVVSILYNIWLGDNTDWSEQFSNQNERFLMPLATGFLQCNTQSPVAGGVTYTLEEVRDYMRRGLGRVSPTNFRWGEYTSVDSVLSHILTTPDPVTTSTLSCMAGHDINRGQAFSYNWHMSVVVESESLQAFVDNYRSQASSQCGECGEFLTRTYKFCLTPHIISFELSGQVLHIEDKLQILVNNMRYEYQLRGLIYYGDSHFTSRIVDSSGMTWFHDGIITGSQMVYEGYISSMGNCLTCGDKTAIAALYVLV